MDETTSLLQTIRILIDTCQQDLDTIVVVVCERTDANTLSVAEQCKAQYPHTLKVLWQQRAYVGGAYQDGFDVTTSSHLVMLSADLETDPKDVRRMISLSKKQPDAIIATSRWKAGGGFHKYNWLKWTLNAAFQTIFRTLYRTHLTDMTYGFRLYPTHVATSIRWTELKHPFFLEAILKPLRLGVPIQEIPTKWRARTEGVSNNTLLQTFAYLPVAFKILFMSRCNITHPHRSLGLASREEFA